MRKFIDILGTKYSIRRVGTGQDAFMDKMHFGGYRRSTTKEIVLLNLKTVPEWANEPCEVISRQERETVRHEIVHAVAISIKA